jgi:hypothetical protein
MLARILDAVANKNGVKIISDGLHAIFAHELQSALNLTVGFPNAYFEMQTFI